MTVNWKELRQDFPILKTTINEQPLIYLDHAATSQKPKPVIDALKNYYETANANVYRSVHSLSGAATEAYEHARTTVKNFIHAESSQEIVFTSGTTESINLLAQMVKKEIKPGDEILLTYMEHHSNIVPWQELAKETGAKIVYTKLTEDLRLNVADYEAKVGPQTKIVAFSHVSNVTGVINPVEKMVKIAHKYDAYVLVDGAQAVGHLPVDVRKLDADFYAFSGHKMLGPTGIGVLYGKKELLNQLEPGKYGGEMIERVQEDASTWASLPHKFEAGTPNIAGAVGLAAAMTYLKEIGSSQIQEREAELTRYLLERIQTVEGIELYGPLNLKDRVGVLAFNLGDIHPHDLATGLDLEGIAIRAGHHCAQLLLQELGVFATSRISLSFYNTKEEIDRVIDSLEKVKEFFSDAT